MWDVVILGGGLAGSSLAAMLGSLGWRTLLVERRHFPHHKVCGEFLSPESQASLWAMGLYDTVLTLRPSAMDHACLVSRRGTRLRMKLPGTAWGVSRFALDAALLDAAKRAGAEVWSGVTATGLDTASTTHSVDLRSSQGQTRVQARAVIDACGRHTQPALRPGTHGTAFRRTYIGVKCHYEGIALPPRVDLFLLQGGYAGLSPIEDGRVNLCVLASRAAFERAGGNAAAMLAAAASENPALGRRLRQGHAVPETQVAVAPVDTQRPAVPWDRIARVGDAAVMIAPLCGDGMAAALRGAEICGPMAHDFLGGRLSRSAWEAEYRAAWHSEFSSRVRIGRALQALLSRPAVSDALLGLGTMLPFIAARLVHATRGSPRPLGTVPPIVPPLSPP